MNYEFRPIMNLDLFFQSQAVSELPVVKRKTIKNINF